MKGRETSLQIYTLENIDEGIEGSNKMDTEGLLTLILDLCQIYFWGLFFLTIKFVPYDL